MIERIIALSIRFPYRVISTVVFLCVLTTVGMRNMAFDALPEITDPQIMVEIVWETPTERLDKEAAEPVSRAIHTIPGVRTVRTVSEMGYGFVYIVLADDADKHEVRQEIARRLPEIEKNIPPGARIRLGPDASSVGWIYQYVLVDRSFTRDLRQLHDLQTRRVAPLLAGSPGVAEIATVGGLKRQIQIHVYPPLLAHYHLTLSAVAGGVKDALADAGGRMVEVSGRDFQIRAVTPVRSLDELEAAVIGRDGSGRPVRIRDIGFVQIVFDLRRGIADLDGEQEVVGGIVVMRQGENAILVLSELKRRVEAAKKLLPPGVEWKVVYDRSSLVRSAIQQMGRTLAEELVAVAAVCFVFLLHLRSALVPILILPVICWLPFLCLRLFGVAVHVPVLAGIAIALGEIVDAILVMIENVHRKAEETSGSSEPAVTDRQLTEALVQVGRPLFFSLAIILFSFLPVFLLEAQEGRLFRPLALAKTFAMTTSVILSLTLAPALIALLLRRIRPTPDERIPVSRALHAVYAPSFRWAMRHPRIVIALNVLLLLAFPLWWRMDKSFMPPLEEGTILYMPTTLPGLPLKEAGWVLQKQDRIIRSFPEVAIVFGKAGRAESPTDPAPISMIETTITLNPKSSWRPGMTHDRLISEMDGHMQFPGWINAWTQPIRGRMDMLATGIRTELGVVLLADELTLIETAAVQVERILSSTPGVRNAYAERPTLGYFLDVQFDRKELSRLGLTEREASEYLQIAMSGAEIARFRGAPWDSPVLQEADDPVTLLFAREYVDEIHKIEELPVVLADGQTVPLSKIGTVRLKTSPAAIRREQGRWAGYVHADVPPSRSGRVVEEVRRHLLSDLPSGVDHEIVGQYQYRDRAFRRLCVALPVVLVIILYLLQLAFRSWLEATILMLSVPAAMVGGILSQALAGYPTTVAVLVGYIALYAVAVQTGVVMVVYLKEAADRRRGADGSLTEDQLEEAVFEGAIRRLRPKLMTVATTLIGFVPILWSEGPGAEMLRHIAVPMMGGMVTSTLHVLYLTPILFLRLHRRG